MRNAVAAMLALALAAGGMNAALAHEHASAGKEYKGQATSVNVDKGTITVLLGKDEKGADQTRTFEVARDAKFTSHHGHDPKVEESLKSEGLRAPMFELGEKGTIKRPPSVTLHTEEQDGKETVTAIDAFVAHEPNAFHHVQDTGRADQGENVWEITGEGLGNIHITLPNILGFQITKFMVLEVIAALLILLLFVPLAGRIQNGALPSGKWWNLREAILLFVRDEIVRPNLDAKDHGHDDHGHGHAPAAPGHAEPAHGAGHHHEMVQPAAAHGAGHHHEPAHAAAHADNPHWQSDRFLPFFWTLFLFILFCNLLGMLPFAGSPTASIWVTGGLAALVFVLLHGSGVAKFGAVGYLKTLWPGVDVPGLGPIISAGIWGIELMGTVIKSGVLAVRLFANMFGGHMVLATLLVFIWQAGVTLKAPGHKEPEFSFIWVLVTIASVLGQVALSLLELFVAFLQAYVFTYLTAIFMGMAINPEH